MKKAIKIILAYAFIGFFSFEGKSQNKRVYDSLIQIVETLQNDDVQLCILYNKIAFNSSSPDQTILYANRAKELAKKIKNRKKEALSNLYLGDGHRLKGNLSKAISYYLESANIYESIGEFIGVSTVYSNLGNVYLAQKNYENSKLYFNKAIYIFSEAKDSTRLATTLLNMGELYREHHVLDSALIYFQRSKVVFKRLNYPIGTAYNLGNIGLVLAEKGEYDQAEQNMNQAITLLEELGDRYPIAVYQTWLAEIYAQRGKYDRAVKYAKSSLDIGIEEGLKEQIRDASLKLSEFYKSSGNSDQAYSYLKQYVTYRDSINNEETIRKMADLRTEYEVAKKQTELDLLSDQAKLNRIVAWSAVFIIALLLMLTIALLKIYRIKDRAVRIVRQRRRVIAAQRNKLDEENKTKDRFFSIISHDIRGPISNFQGISGLINVLADSNDADGLRQLGIMMEDSAKEVSVLLDNLLEWALSQEGRIPYHPEAVNLKEVSQENLNIMLNLAIAKQVNLKSDLPVDIIVDVDKNSVSTIVRNLLSNSIKFTSEGKEVKLTIREENSEGVIIVQDTGIGIPKEKLDTLFMLKGTRSRWGTKGEKGIGLGLLLVHEFVELNQGRIEVESEEGTGTTFKVYVPLSVQPKPIITHE